MRIEDALRELVTVRPHAFSGGVDRRAIEAASTALGVPFPSGYIQFLARYGAGHVSFQELIGLGGALHLDVVNVTRDLRERKGSSLFPNNLIAVLGDGGGNYECIDTAQPTPSDEFRIVRWLHDGGAEQECEVLADSYPEWLWDTVQFVKTTDAGNERG